MLERGAQVECVDMVEGGYKWSAVNSAAAAGHKQVVELLVRKRADLNATNSHGHTALHSAAARGHIHIVRFLCEIDEEFWQSTDEYKQWARADGKATSFEDSGFWIATTEYLNKKSTGENPRTAAELAGAFDHDFVKDLLDEKVDALSLVEQRRGGTNKPPPPPRA